MHTINLCSIEDLITDAIMSRPTGSEVSLALEIWNILSVEMQRRISTLSTVACVRLNIY